MGKRKADIIRAAQCPDCGKFMDKIERRNDITGKMEIWWRCTTQKCREKV